LRRREGAPEKGDDNINDLTLRREQDFNFPLCTVLKHASSMQKPFRFSEVEYQGFPDA
jgi:hypothetical protein